MPRRRRRWPLVAAAAVGMVLVAVLVLPQNHPIDRATFDRIRVGMTRAEVEDLLGGRPVAVAPVPPAAGRTKAAWIGSEGGCVVVFDDADRVVSKTFSDRKTAAAERTFIRLAEKVKAWVR